MFSLELGSCGVVGVGARKKPSKKSSRALGLRVALCKRGSYRTNRLAMPRGLSVRLNSNEEKQKSCQRTLRGNSWRVEAILNHENRAQNKRINGNSTRKSSPQFSDWFFPVRFSTTDSCSNDAKRMTGRRQLDGARICVSREFAAAGVHSRFLFRPVCSQCLLVEIGMVRDETEEVRELKWLKNQRMTSNLKCV